MVPTSCEKWGARGGRLDQNMLYCSRVLLCTVVVFINLSYKSLLLFVWVKLLAISY